MPITVGQMLWYVPQRWGGRRPEGRAVIVTSVARKWATLNNRTRIDKSTLEEDGKGYSSPARCYLSREVYDARERTLVAYGALRTRMYEPPHDITEADIHRAAELLGITLPLPAPVAP